MSMKSRIIKFFEKKGLYLLLIGLVSGIIITFPANEAIEYTSTDQFCASCHVHPHVHQSWKLSSHYDNKRGIIVHCTECHLPPKGSINHITEKAKTGIRDVYGVLFKDVDQINWEEKSKLVHAKYYVYNESCIACHQNLFPIGLSSEGAEAHLYYSEREEEMNCINCHLHVGHFDENAIHAKNVDFGKNELAYKAGQKSLYTKPARIDSFKDFTEYVPNTPIDFHMKAIPSGSFRIGSSEDETFRDEDEGPQVNVTLNRFFMSETEVTWDLYLAFLRETLSEGRYENYRRIPPSEMVDGITGPTPPYGNPDQGWGQDARPAITMTHYAAEVFCHWLSQKTGKKYRLPTEAEWEYAARANTKGPYFFEGSPKDYSEKVFFNRIFGVDTNIINSFAIYDQNSFGKTAVVHDSKPNPFGLKNMLGNVAEFCSDFYDEKTYQLYENNVSNPEGPEKGEEYVIRGGSYQDDAAQLRCTDREQTKTQEWLLTDPQMPKSIWWYSDANHVGIRLVCEYDKEQHPEQ